MNIQIHDPRPLDPDDDYGFTEEEIEAVMEEEGCDYGRAFNILSRRRAEAEERDREE